MIKLNMQIKNENLIYDENENFSKMRKFLLKK